MSLRWDYSFLFAAMLLLAAGCAEDTELGRETAPPNGIQGDGEGDPGAMEERDRAPMNREAIPPLDDQPPLQDPERPQDDQQQSPQDPERSQQDDQRPPQDDQPPGTADDEAQEGQSDEEVPAPSENPDVEQVE